MGAGIIILAFYLTNDGQELTQNDKFMWISIAAMYLVLFLPFFFSVIRIGNFSFKIPSLAMVWTGIFFYILASIAVIFLLKKGSISFNAAVIVQAILVFIFAIDIYFGYFANFHIQNVAREEEGLRQYLAEIKAKAASLSLAAQRLPSGYEQIQKCLIRALEDIKYLTPVQNNLGTGEEIKILSAIDSIKLLCETTAEGAHPVPLEAEVNKLQMLVKERKLLRN
jgi:hypothetical protein